LKFMRTSKVQGEGTEEEEGEGEVEKEQKGPLALFRVTVGRELLFIPKGSKKKGCWKTKGSLLGTTEGIEGSVSKSYGEDGPMRKQEKSEPKKDTYP